MAILKLNLKNLKQNDIDTYFLKQTRTIEECLVWATENSCSDLYIKVGERPYVSRYGKVVQLPCTPITKEMWASFYDLNVLNELNAEYVQRKLLDISVEIRIPDTSPYYGKYESNFYRYRASFGFSGTKNICTFRMIRPKKPTFDTITYPEECIEKLYDVLQRRDGILIFTGPTGSGKALRKDTLIPTPYGFKYLGRLKKGHKVIAIDGSITTITDIYNPSCKYFYNIEFNNKTSLNVAEDHLWKINLKQNDGSIVHNVIVNTRDLVMMWMYDCNSIIIHRPACNYKHIKPTYRRAKDFYITNIKRLYRQRNSDYMCISVDHPSHMFLCGIDAIPTHNSTTMAACVNTFSEPGEILDNKVFITLEDPIENTFSNTASFKITQKELGKDFKSFELGIKAALREHPNYIIIGECRDKAVICATLEACKTGHGTITTYHSNDVPGTISRMLYHLENDKNLSYDLIMHINMIVSQTLVPSNSGYVVDVQYLVFNDTVRKYLIEVIDADKNVAVEVRKLMQNADLIEAGIVRNWYYQK